MSYSGSNMPVKRHTILVVGQGAAVAAVTDGLSQLPGVGTVRQVQGFDPARATQTLMGVDHIVEMMGGVAPAFTLAMAALSHGIAFTTANPMLVAAHGRVLQNAARGQQTYFGLQGAGFGLPLAEMMGAVRPKKVTVSFATAATVALARMAFRNESLGHVSAHLKLQNVDLSDWGGKQTQARAMALRSLWFDSELRGSQLARMPVDAVEPQDVKRLRGFGLQPVYGAEIMEDGIYTGPMAVANGSALVNSSSEDVLVAETEFGRMVLRQEAHEEARIVSGVVADMRMYLRSPRPALKAEVKRFDARATAGVVQAYVRIPYAAKQAVLEVKPEIVAERVEGDGLWQGVVELMDLSALQIGALGGMVFPISGEWEAPVAGGLRMVG